MQQRKIEFTATGSSALVGNFSSGDVWRGPEDHCTHLVEVHGCAKWADVAEQVEQAEASAEQTAEQAAESAEQPVATQAAEADAPAVEAQAELVEQAVEAAEQPVAEQAAEAATEPAADKPATSRKKGGQA